MWVRVRNFLCPNCSQPTGKNNKLRENFEHRQCGGESRKCATPTWNTERHGNELFDFAYALYRTITIILCTRSPTFSISATLIPYSMDHSPYMTRLLDIRCRRPCGDKVGPTGGMVHQMPTMVKNRPFVSLNTDWSVTETLTLYLVLLPCWCWCWCWCWCIVVTFFTRIDLFWIEYERCGRQGKRLCLNQS